MENLICNSRLVANESPSIMLLEAELIFIQNTEKSRENQWIFSRF